MIKKYEFDNGLKLVYETPFNNNKYSSLMIGVNFGSIHEPKNMKGAAHFIEHMCFKGNKHIKECTEISKNFDKYGAYLNAYTDKKYTNYIISCNNDNLIPCFNILVSMILFSIFEKKDFDKEYNVVIEENLRDKQDFNDQLNTMIDKFIYDGSNYKLPIDDLDYHKNKLKNSELFKLYKEYYVPENITVSICSNISYNKIIKMIKSSHLSKENNSKININVPLSIKSQENYHIQTKIDKLTNVTYIAFSFKTCGYLNEDIHVLNLIKTILSSGMSSRLFTNFREKFGLTYASDCTANFFEHMGDITLTCETNYDKLFINNGIMQIFINIINDIKNKPIKIDEINKAKGLIDGEHKILLNDNKLICESNLINTINDNLNYSIKDEFKLKIKNIDYTLIKTVINKYFNKNNLTVTIISNKSINNSKIKKYIEKIL